MSLTKEFIEAQKLDETQVAAINTEHDTEIADVKKEYDGKANADAEAIIDGAMTSTIKTTGIQRDQGEKAAIYLARVAPLFLTGQVASEKKKLEDAEKVLQDKIKTSKPDELLTGQFNDLKSKFDGLQAKEAEFDRIAEAGFETKYTETVQKNEALTRNMAFSRVRPTFPETANTFEVNAKWDEFKANILKDYDLVFDEENPEPLCSSKDNIHKQFKLADLVEKDDKLSALRQGRKLTGTGAKTDTVMTDLKGIPFKVPENATPEQRTSAVREYITQVLKIAFLDPRYAAEFTKWKTHVMQGTAPKTT